MAMYAVTPTISLFEERTTELVKLLPKLSSNVSLLMKNERIITRPQSELHRASKLGILSPCGICRRNCLFSHVPYTSAIST